MDNNRGTAQSTLCVDNKKDKTELKAMCVTDIKKKLEFHGFRFKSAIPWIPRSRKITGPRIGEGQATWDFDGHKNGKGMASF